MEKIGQFSASSCESLDDAEALVPKADSDTNNPELTEVEVRLWSGRSLGSSAVTYYWLISIVKHFASNIFSSSKSNSVFPKKSTVLLCLVLAFDQNICVSRENPLDVFIV